MNTVSLIILNVLIYGIYYGGCQQKIGRPKISNSTECYRPCTIDGPRKICYYKFVLENYMSNGHACRSCFPGPNNPLLNTCHCVWGDGFERAVKTVNRMIPGPSIQVCLGDRVVVDLENHLEGEETAIHWHGILQRGTQYYDGVPFVTQCPISQGQTFRKYAGETYQLVGVYKKLFRYQWDAAERGTKFWHSHSGLQEMDGVYGSIIIREPRSADVHGKLYDTDRSEHVIIISEWMHELAAEHFPGRLVNLTGQISATFLINGKGQFNMNNFTEKVEIFNVSPNKRHRFRLINAFGSVCPARITFEKHKLIVIATDGEDIEPTVVNSITSFTGERYDFIIHTNQPPSTYWITLQGLGECGKAKIQQRAVLRYEGENFWSLFYNVPSFNRPLPSGIVLNPFDTFCDKGKANVICINKLRNVKPIEKAITKTIPDYKIFLAFQFQTLRPEAVFNPKNPYTPFLVAPTGNMVRSLINNVSSVFPTSPLISQYHDIPKDTICNFMNNCQTCKTTYNCTHVINVPFNAIVEVIIVDEVQVPNLSHPFHLHGNSFYVLNMDVTPLPANQKMTAKYIMEQDKLGLLQRNFNRPPLKDTLAVPRNGYIVVRYRADNPGFWLLHCHFQFHIVIGMNLILQVGDHNLLPPVPTHFPKCGNFLPPIQSLH